MSLLHTIPFSPSEKALKLHNKPLPPCPPAEAAYLAVSLLAKASILPSTQPRAGHRAANPFLPKQKESKATQL